MFPGNISAIKSPGDGTKFDITAQDVRQANDETMGQQNQLALNMRDKSVERKNTAGTAVTSNGVQVKDIQKELQKARKTLREKEKEMVKMRAEVNTWRKESQEKAKNDNQMNKDQEGYVKSLKDKLREVKLECKRKEDKVIEHTSKQSKLEE